MSGFQPVVVVCVAVALTACGREPYNKYSLLAGSEFCSLQTIPEPWKRSAKFERSLSSFGTIPVVVLMPPREKDRVYYAIHLDPNGPIDSESLSQNWAEIDFASRGPVQMRHGLNPAHYTRHPSRGGDFTAFPMGPARDAFVRSAPDARHQNWRGLKMPPKESSGEGSKGTSVLELPITDDIKFHVVWTKDRPDPYGKMYLEIYRISDAKRMAVIESEFAGAESDIPLHNRRWLNSTDFMVTGGLMQEHVVFCRFPLE